MVFRNLDLGSNGVQTGEKMQGCQVDQKASKSIEKVDRIRKSICQIYVYIII